ncbi:hypothetical protein HT031_000283 [Scenedesmus sp. PABB004]|nr:hypothetical protein HT031_000283 [Scenedesmus sp. PABB004]
MADGGGFAAAAAQQAAAPPLLRPPRHPLSPAQPPPLQQLQLQAATSSDGGAPPAGAPARAWPPELQRALERLAAGVLRGAAIGLTLRGGLHAVGAGLAAASRRRDRALTRGAALEDALRYAAFLGALAGTYIGVDEGIAAAVGKDRSAKWRSLVAGVCAGPALLLTGPKNRHYSLATYILLRGVTLLIRTGNAPRSARRHPWLHAALAPTRLAHGDTVIMCAACAQIIYAFIMMPTTLPASYVRFIRKQGAKELHVWQGIRVRRRRSARAGGGAHARRGPRATPARAPTRARTPRAARRAQELAERTAAGRPRGPLLALAGTRHAGAAGPLPCSFFHPGTSCAAHPVSLFWPAYRRALSVYLPVYVLPALLVHRQQLLKAPLPILQKVLLGIARSSLFLSSFICVAFGGACAGHALAGRSTGLVIAGSTWVGGLATLLEKKSRRMELALYVLSRSLESFARCCLQWGWLSPRLAAAAASRLDVLLFAAGVGAITHCYSGYNGLHRGVFRSKYLNILDFVFGSAGAPARRGGAARRSGAGGRRGARWPAAARRGADAVAAPRRARAGITEGCIKHCPSNADLLKSVSSRVRSLSVGNLAGLAERTACEAAAVAAAGALPAPGSGGGGGGSLGSCPGGAAAAAVVVAVPPAAAGPPDGGSGGAAVAVAVAQADAAEGAGAV